MRSSLADRESATNGASCPSSLFRIQRFGKGLLPFVLVFLLGFTIPRFPNIDSPPVPVSIASVTGGATGGGTAIVEVVVRNRASAGQRVEVTWYLSYPGEGAPGQHSLFSSSPISVFVGSGRRVSLRWRLKAAVQPGDYQLTAAIQRYGSGAPEDVLTSTELLPIAGGS